ncbi:WXG100-like domain-containing protein [Streptomyces sp. NPDC054786]
MATIMLPTEVDWILDLLGFQWPNVDEDKMREAAEAWSSFAAAARRHQAEGTTAANTVRGANSGEAIEAFSDHWKKYGDGGGYLDEAIEAAEVLAVVLQVVATIVMVMKIAVIAQLIALAVEFAIAQAAAPVTLGASEAGAAAATATTRVIVRRIINEAKQKIVQAITEAIEKKVVKSAKEMAVDLLKDIGKDALKGLGQNVATQGIKSHFGAQDGFDWKEAGRAGLKPVVDIDDKGHVGFGDKLKDVGKVGTGAYHMGQGVGQVAQGDFSGGGKKIWEGQQEQAAGLTEVAGIVTKDKEAPAEGDGSGEGGTSDGGADSSSGSGGSGGSSESGGSGSSASSSGGSSSSGGGAGESGGPASTDTSTRSATPTPPPAPTTESGQAEADRARNAFG